MAALHHNKPPKLDLTAAHAKCAMLLPLSLSFAASKGLYALKGHWLGSGLCLIFLLVPSALSKCPNWCSQHGICTGPGDDAYCICEMGFQGDDCGIRLCPKGDDPLTTNQADRALLLRTTAEEGLISGELTVTFNGESTTLDANAHRTGDRECASALQALPNIDRVACTRGAVSEYGGADYLVSLLSFPTTPWENNLYGHFGNPALDAFACNISSESDSFASSWCEIIDVVTENIKEYTECSGHGRCVRETGRCECSFGFRGEACDDISDSDDAQVVIAEGPFFTGSTLKLRANRGPSPDYDFVKAIAGPHDVMTLTGTGDLVLHKGTLHVQPPPFVHPGNTAGTNAVFPFLDSSPWHSERPPKALTVSGGSLDVRGGGAEIRSTRVNSPALSVSVGLRSRSDQGSCEDGDGTGGGFGENSTAWQEEDVDEAFSYTGVALAVNVRESGLAASGPESFRLLELSVGGKQTRSSTLGEGGKGEEDDGQDSILLSVRGDGQVSMAGGGGVVLREGDLEVSRGDAAFKGNVVVGRGLEIAGEGASFSGGRGLRVADGGFAVLSSSEATKASAAGDQSPAVGHVSASHERFSGEVLRIEAEGEGAAEAGAVLLRGSTAGQHVFEVKATGATSIKAGGLEVEAGGLNVRSGGATVSSGGLAVDGGIVLRSGTLVIEGDGGGDGSGGDGGFEVAHGGIRTVSGDAATPALAATAVGAGFGGAVLSVSAPDSSPSSSFRLLQATVAGTRNSARDSSDSSEERKQERQQEVFLVDGTGRVTAVGGLETGPSGNLVARGGLVSEGPTVLERRRAIRGGKADDAVEAKNGRTGDGSDVGDRKGGDPVVVVDASIGTFFEVPDDGLEGSPNELRIKGEASPGQIIVVHNGDADQTSGAAVIPPGYTVLFIYDGSTWRDVRVLEAAVRELRGVTSLTAAADLDIGDFALKARHLVSSGNEAGGVALFGGGGLITSDKGLSWNSQTGTLTVPRLQAPEVAEGMDFKGKPARNVALVNATIDRIPFLMTGRLMLEAGAVAGSGMQHAGAQTPRALATLLQSSGPGYGLAVLDKKGELSRADGVVVFPGGVVDVRGLGPHLQHGDVDFQGYAARNLSLSGVSTISGLERLEVGSLFLKGIADDNDRPRPKHENIGPSSLVVLTSAGELLAAGETFSVDTATGTLVVPRIGTHEITGDVDHLGNSVRNMVLQNPEIRGTVPSLHTSELKVSVQASVSRGYLAVFSSTNAEDQVGGATGRGGNALGLASGGGGLAWRDGALQDVTFGGTTTLDGDLDLKGHRLLNYNFEVPDIDRVDALTIRETLTLNKHKGASSLGEILVVTAGGSVAPANPASLSIKATSASVANVEVSERLVCRGNAEISGHLSIAGDVSVDGEVKLAAGLDAGGARVANARLTSVSFEGVVKGDMGVEGAVRIGALKREKGGTAGGVVVVGDGGELRVATGLELEEEGGVLHVQKISGHEVTGTVDFGGEEVLSPSLNFSAGGGISGLAALSVGTEGIDVSGVLSAASDVIVEGSVTVGGAVMGRGPYMDTSDARMKAEVRDISAADAAAIVKGLRAVTYTLKPDVVPTSKSGSFRRWAHAGRRQHGFIAQEVEKVAPEVVAEDDSGYKAVAYSRLVPTLAAALSEALNRLDTLEGSLATSVAAAKPRGSSTSLNSAAPKHLTTGPEAKIIDALHEVLEAAAPSGGGRGDATVDGEQELQRETPGEMFSQQKRRASESGPVGSVVVQLSMENKALRGRVEEMEKRMVELERKLASVVPVGAVAIENSVLPDVATRVKSERAEA